MSTEKIKELVEKFRQQSGTYKSKSYNETQVRQDFIDPLFQELGWDIYNKTGKSETYRDVLLEDTVTVKEGKKKTVKHPDYCFKIGIEKKFFVEAKAPRVDIKEDIDPAFQIRSYGWSANLPLSILTDFEEFSVYDTRLKPKSGDNPSTSRILYCNYEDYLDPEKWKNICNIFSKDAIEKGFFDKYVSSENKKGTTTVDDAFLSEIENWREQLARNIASQNSLTQEELNHVVQSIIDRIIFLRICEDRGIEEYGRLKEIYNKEIIFNELLTLFYLADEKYNSGLFHFRNEKGRESNPDSITPQLKIKNNTLKNIIQSFYYPSPYEFSVMPSDILGSVYERFIGKTITLTQSGKRVKVEDKPEVKKAGGIYYTPKYIVDYIVKHTVGEVLKGKSPETVKDLSILDPACGSGSFLIQVYQFLLDWYLEQYHLNTKKYQKKITQGQ